MASGRFDVVQASVNVVDQANLGRGVAAARSAGLGCIAKRPLAGAPWRQAEPPSTPDGRAYWERWNVLAPAWPDTGDRAAWALRFVLAAPGVDTCLVGGTNPKHLAANISAATAAPMDPDEVAAIMQVYAAAGAAWPAII